MSGSYHALRLMAHSQALHAESLSCFPHVATRACEERVLTKLLVGSAGGTAAEHAEAMARRIAERAGAECEVLGVETAGLSELTGRGETVRHSEPAGPRSWVRGIPGVEIVHRAKAHSVDLIVLGRGQSCQGEILPPGRTADTVIRRHDGPCLLIPPSARRLDRMLLAFDGTQRGLGILEPAVMLAEAMGAVCRSVYVSSCDPSTDAEGAAWTDAGSRRIRRALAGFPSLDGDERLTIRCGAAVREVLAEAAAWEANLLVVGVRRGGPPGEMGSGHVGQDLLRSAPVAILTVPI